MTVVSRQELPPPPGAPPARKAFRVSSAVTRRVKLVDRIADAVIRVGGVLVIAAIALIFVFIIREIVPLFLPASLGPAQVHAVARTEPAPLLAGSDEFETFAWLLRSDGSVEVHTLAGWEERPALRSALVGARRVTAASLALGRGLLFLGTDDGQVVLAQLHFEPTFAADGVTRTITPSLKDLARVKLPGEAGAVSRVVGRVSSSEALSFVAQVGETRLVVATVTSRGLEQAEEAQGLLAAPPGEELLDGPFQVRAAEGPLDGPVVALAIDSEADRLFAATAAGTLYHWQLQARGARPFASYPRPGAEAAALGVAGASPGDASRRVSALDVLLGDQTLVVGYDDGTLEDWLGVRQQAKDSLKRVRPVRRFEPLPGKVVALRPSGRDKTFLAASSDGSAQLAYASSGRTLARWKVEGEPQELAYGPKLTSTLALTRAGTLDYRTVANPHPDLSAGMLFGKVWYEGYDQPEYIWQSSSGSDAFEPKFSLVPLIVGTLKGAFYGLLFAVPIALFAALYTSQFLSPSLRSVIKPLLEVMAALPSVVIGFLAGLWLAPALENTLPALLFLIVLTPVTLLLVTAAWRVAPRALKTVFPEGREVFVLVPVVILCLWASVTVGPGLDAWLFHGDLKQWVFDTFAVRVEQRNSIVVGIAMGFAVIPMIFTISDDAFTNVPRSFTSASLALGASRWQTALRVIAPTASPGVFSAVMIGFGRAVGETMIVLMATGNTPVLSFSPFNGMRTLSANIAVEIPEAPLGETHYRILFLAALLLFILTFVVNTAAEVVRQRLREKYQAV